MRWVPGPDAATVRAWARQTGRAGGTRGAVSTRLQNEYVAGRVTGVVRSATLGAARVTLTLAPVINRAAADCRSRRAPGADPGDPSLP